MRKLLLVLMVSLVLSVGIFARGRRPANNAAVSYEESLIELYETLGREYPAFDLKGIDWKKVGEEFLPRAKKVRTNEELLVIQSERQLRR